jgi:hypothetical protein
MTTNTASAPPARRAKPRPLPRRTLSSPGMTAATPPAATAMTMRKTSYWVTDGLGIATANTKRAARNTTPNAKASTMLSLSPESVIDGCETLRRAMPASIRSLFSSSSNRLYCRPCFVQRQADRASAPPSFRGRGIEFLAHSVIGDSSGTMTDIMPVDVPDIDCVARPIQRRRAAVNPPEGSGCAAASVR